MMKSFRMTVSGIDLALIRAIRSLSVKARFFLMVIIISVTPILVIGVISYIKSDADIVSKISVYSLQVVKQLSLTINAKLLSWEQHGNIIASSEDVQNLLANYDDMDEADQYLAIRAIQKIMKEALRTSLDIQEPDIITSNGRVISPSNYTTSNTSPFIMNIDGADKIKEMSKAADGSYVWYTEDIAKRAEKGLIVLSRSIKDINAFDKWLGYLMLRVDTNYLYGLYESVNLGSGSKIYLMDSKYMVVLSGDRKEVGEGINREISSRIQREYNNGVYDGTINDIENKYLAAYSRIPVSGWTVVALIPNTYLSSLSMDIRNIVIIVGIICLIVSLMFFSVIYRSITIPLGQLIGSMREVKKGKLESKKVDEEARDEVAEVTISYNNMIHELSQHIESIKAKEKQKSLAEFRALQAQINPHFIANTLSNVAWLAKMQKADNIETVATSLIQLLNASMGRGSDIITIREEIQNLRSYLNIQEFKYFKKIEVYFEIDDDIIEYKILRFILQPIIENAIIHGLGPKQGKGMIILKGNTESSDMVINVTDTGIGMDQEEIDKLLCGEKEAKDSFNSIGLKNVNERIKLSYGDNYGLIIRSKKDAFTSVEIRLPLIS